MADAESFARDLNAWTVKLEPMPRLMLVEVAAEVFRSIVDGSELTGSRGQPVGQYGPGYNEGQVGGTLKASWQQRFVGPETVAITTNEAYAEQNEDGIARPGGGPYLQRSSVGGRWSVALTKAGLPQILTAVAKRMNP